MAERKRNTERAAAVRSLAVIRRLRNFTDEPDEASYHKRRNQSRPDTTFDVALVELKMGKEGGWWNERARHALAVKGIKTKQVSRGVHRVIDKDRKDELQRGISIAEQAGDSETAKDLRGALKRESQVVEVVEEVAVKKAPEEKEEETKDKKGRLRW